MSNFKDISITHQLQLLLIQTPLESPMLLISCDQQFSKPLQFDVKHHLKHDDN